MTTTTRQTDTEKAKIFIVEDETIAADDLKYCLTYLGYDVVGWASCGEEAMNQLSKSNPNLVLMDIMLKGPMDGVEAAEKIRLIFQLPVIFLSAYSDDPMIQRAKLTEPFGYLTKPYEERELKTNIDIALYRHRIEREKEQLTLSLQDALLKIQKAQEKIKVLSGLLPICSWCKKIRDDQGYWKEVEAYVTEYSEAEFTHGMCPQCLEEQLSYSKSDVV